MDLMQELRRTCYCGEVTTPGETVVVGGFVQKVRNLGNLIFIDLRDRTGIVQLAFNDQTDKAVFEKAASCHSEYVLMNAILTRLSVECASTYFTATRTTTAKTLPSFSTKSWTATSCLRFTI